MNEGIRVSVDCVVFDKNNRLLLIKRKNPPFKDMFALPGGFVEVNETTENAAARELREETGLAAESARLIGVYSKPERDPRGRVVSVAYLIKSKGTDIRSGDDAASAEFVDDWKRLELAFDHEDIVSDALEIR